MGERTQRREQRVKTFQESVTEIATNPAKYVMTRLIAGAFYALIAAGVTAYITLQVLQGQLHTLSNNVQQWRQTQQYEFQELSLRMDMLADHRYNQLIPQQDPPLDPRKDPLKDPPH